MEPGYGRFTLTPRTKVQYLGFEAMIPGYDQSLNMALHPEQIQALDGDLAQRILALTGPVAVDLDRALSADDE